VKIDRENNIYMTRGDQESLRVSCPGRPFREGDVVELTVRRSAGTGAVLLHKRVTEFADGKASVDILPEDTAGLPFCTASYDVQVTFTDLGPKTIIRPAQFRIGRENTYES